MSKEEVSGRIQARLGEILRDLTPEKLVPTASLRDDLGMDSLFMLESAMALEEEFGITMVDTDLPRLQTLGDLTDYVLERMAA